MQLILLIMLWKFICYTNQDNIQQVKPAFPRIGTAMCNLSQGIRENATDNAIAGVIMNMHRKGYTLEQIAECVEKTIEEVEAVIRKREPVLAYLNLSSTGILYSVLIIPNFSSTVNSIESNVLSRRCSSYFSSYERRYLTGYCERGSTEG